MRVAAYFTPAFFDFFRELKRNNNRPWFEKNKLRYERVVRDPLIAFVAAAGPKLRKISPHFIADPRPVGGSVFRIYRDIRFSKDKTPYKTAGACHFPHERRESAPGFYLHLEPGGVYSGVGIWHPDSSALGKIRDALVRESDRWAEIKSAKPFKENLTIEGGSLKTVPRGYPKDHRLADDLKRTDFTAGHSYTERQACAPDFVDRFIDTCRSAGPFTKFLTDALGLPF